MRNPYAQQGSLEEAWQSGFEGRPAPAYRGSPYAKAYEEGVNAAAHARRVLPDGLDNITKLRTTIHRSRENSVALLGGGNVTVMDSTLVDRIQAVLFEANMVQQAAANNAPLDEIKQRLVALDLAACV